MKELKIFVTYHFSTNSERKTRR